MVEVFVGVIPIDLRHDTQPKQVLPMPASSLQVERDHTDQYYCDEYASDTLLVLE